MRKIDTYLHLFLQRFLLLVVPAASVRCGDGAAATAVVMGGGAAAIAVVVALEIAAVIGTCC